MESLQQGGTSVGFDEEGRCGGMRVSCFGTLVQEKRAVFRIDVILSEWHDWVTLKAKNFTHPDQLRNLFTSVIALGETTALDSKS